MLDLFIILLFLRKFRHKLTPKMFVLSIGSFLIGRTSVLFIIPRLRPLHIDPLPASTIVYDIDHHEIGERVYTSSHSGENQEETYGTKGLSIRHRPVNYNELSGFLINTLIEIEDQRFRHHRGIDLHGIGRAMRNNITRDTPVQGASTIASQTIRNYYRLNQPRTIRRKLSEMYLARALSLQYNKKEILTLYCDRLYFGYLNYGFASATQWYFAKDLSQLTDAERFALIIISKNSNKYDPFRHPNTFNQRFNLIATSLLDRHIRTKKQYDQITSELLLWNTNHKPRLPYIQDYLTQHVHLSNPPSSLQTTISLTMTQAIKTMADQTIFDLQWKNVSDYGILVVDRATKEIRVMIGGKDYTNDGGGQVNAVFARNQAGSTLKPFTYLYAFNHLGYTPNSTIMDIPIQFHNQFGYAYNPKNFNLSYQGPITIAEALASSLNVPAITIASKIGVANLLQWYRSLGFEGLQKNADYYGLALTLGVGEVNLYELVRAFGIFAYQGKIYNFRIISSSSPSLLLHLTQQKDIRGTRYIEQILSDRYAKLHGFPINSNLDFPNIFVVKKSGTSRNFSDSRTVGYTDHYLIGVRVGNKDGSAMKGVSGGVGAGDIFHNIVYYLEDSKKTSYKIHKKTIKNEAIKHTFSSLEKQDGQKETIDHKEGKLAITSPLDGSIYQIDPTIPLDQQQIKLEFMTDIHYDTYQWYRNETPYSGTFIPLKKGTNTINVHIISDNDTKDASVHFMVQ